VKFSVALQGNWFVADVTDYRHIYQKIRRAPPTCLLGVTVLPRLFLLALIGVALVSTDASASKYSHRTHSLRHYASGGGEVVAHPAKCPHSSFCGCGAARELGLSDRSLWLVRSWYRFPRAAAAPGMAALWGTRHVAIIREVHGDGTATVYDANSGGGLTRVHRVSLAGLTVVSPQSGSMLASHGPVPAHQQNAGQVSRRARSGYPSQDRSREARAEMFVSFVH